MGDFYEKFQSCLLVADRRGFADVGIARQLLQEEIDEVGSRHPRPLHSVPEIADGHASSFPAIGEERNAHQRPVETALSEYRPDCSYVFVSFPYDETDHDDERPKDQRETVVVVRNGRRA